MSNDSTPPVTVGIPTIGRDFLETTLRSVNDAAAAYSAPITIILASDRKPSILDRVDLPEIPAIRWIQTSGSTHENRQAILDASTTDWILFTDDDCKLDAGIFPAFAAQLTEYEAVGALYGRVSFVGDRSVVFSASQGLASVPFEVTHRTQPVEWAPTANVFISREAAVDVGGFDTSNPIPFSGGDVDLGLRLTRAGYTAYTTPEAIVYHTTATWNSVSDNVRRFFRYGQSETWLATKYPDQCIHKWRDDDVTTSESSDLPPVVSRLLALLPLPTCHPDWSDNAFPRYAVILLLATLFTIVNSIGYHHQILSSTRFSNRLLYQRFRPAGRYL